MLKTEKHQPLNSSGNIQRTRLAPSPTGALHLGNARTFLVNWALARQRGWQIVLRIDDLDGPRIKAGASEDALDMLGWLGLDWDEGPYFQLHDLSPYRHALEQLGRQGDIYPCRCTRKQIVAASLSAPHASDHELRYPGTCRPARIKGTGVFCRNGPDQRCASVPGASHKRLPSPLFHLNPDESGHLRRLSFPPVAPVQSPSCGPSPYTYRRWSVLRH